MHTSSEFGIAQPLRKMAVEKSCVKSLCLNTIFFTALVEYDGKITGVTKTLGVR